MEDVKINNAGESAGKLEHMERFFKHETGLGEAASSAETSGQAVEASIGENSVLQYEPKALKKIMRFFVFGVFILIVGGIGGIVADRWFIPFVVSQPGFSQFAWLQRIKENTVIVKTTEEIKISEDLAMVDAIAKTKSAIATVIVSYNLEQKPVARSKKPLATEIYFEKISGAVITGDGLVLVRPSGFIPPERLKDKVLKSVEYKIILTDKREFIVNDPARIYPYTLKTLAENPIAKAVILKIDASNLPVISFGDTSSLLIGSPAAILGSGVSVGSVAKIEDLTAGNGQDIGAAWKIIYFDKEMANKDFYVGAPLINLKGEMIGLNIINNDGNMTNTFLSMEDLKVFIDSVLGKK